MLVLLVWAIAVGAFVVMNWLTTDIAVGLAYLPPLLAVFIIGVREADHRWTRVAWLTAAPMAAAALWLVVHDLQAPARATYGSGPAAFSILSYAFSTLIVALVAMGLAALGVWIGRRFAEGAPRS